VRGRVDARDPRQLLPVRGAVDLDDHRPLGALDHVDDLRVVERLLREFGHMEESRGVTLYASSQLGGSERPPWIPQGLQTAPAVRPIAECRAKPSTLSSNGNPFLSNMPSLSLKT
jgi:hypothetical protein